ncbi:DUF2752 domain-containing protein [Nocardia cyriacigeorgica]|uniref:DUF2752 domain-containing protein n=1 Tax=Nocardia cyriacigeorgica TaxID=135487 RepID=UPI0013B9509B|nr:DUF2752 domain-containing protein [Nocardia cyriacigeorgica]NEW53916.1 DUF2752 domain-containing protein [Nocardia cyriacigeorgica]
MDIAQPGPVTAGEPPSTRWRAVALPAAVAGAGIVAVAAVHLRDPHVEGSWGICPVYALFGVYCPGCGGMRAVHNLTDGHVLDSLHSNLLALPLLILFALWVGDWAIRAWRGKPMRHLGINAVTMWSIFGFLALFTVVRNTPWGNWLTPV